MPSSIDSRPPRRAGPKDYLEEPYRVFFPLGALWAFVGVNFWVGKAFLPAMEEMSTKVHVWVQVYGFAWSFVVGFLATAIPRITRTSLIGKVELALLLIFSESAVALVCVERYLAAHGVFLAALATLLVCLARRFAKGKRMLPASFVFVPFGFLSALAGTVSLVLVYSGFRWRAAELITLANNLLFQGLLLFLLLGVGGFIIRSILGWGTQLPIKPGQHPDFAKARKPELAACILGAVILFGSFAIESFVHDVAGSALKAMVVSAFCIGMLKVHRRPRSGKLTAHWLRAAMILMTAGFWGEALLSPQYRLAFLHLAFIGGYGLAIVAVATRVVFSHAGCGHLLDAPHRAFSTAATLMTVGLVARFTIDFFPMDATRHLAYAGLIWTGGLVVWVVCVLRAVTRVPVDVESKS